MEVIELKKDEMSLLVGGSCVSLQMCTDEVKNNNSVVDCMCVYNNHSVTNTNSATGCNCKCGWPQG